MVDYQKRCNILSDSVISQVPQSVGEWALSNVLFTCQHSGYYAKTEYTENKTWLVIIDKSIFSLPKIYREALLATEIAHAYKGQTFDNTLTIEQKEDIADKLAIEWGFDVIGYKHYCSQIKLKQLQKHNRNRKPTARHITLFGKHPTIKHPKVNKPRR